MQDLRVQAVQDLLSHGTDEAGFLRVLQHAYAVLGVGPALDFAAVRAYWAGAELPAVWRRALSERTVYDDGAELWYGFTPFSGVQSWMLQGKSADDCFVLGQRCAVLLAPLLRFSGLLIFFAPRVRDGQPRIEPKALRQAALDCHRQWAAALRDGADGWAEVTAAFVAAAADAALPARVLAQVEAADWDSPNEQVQASLALLARLHLTSLLLRERLAWQPLPDADWALGMLREVSRSRELHVKWPLLPAQGEAELAHTLLRPLCQAAVQAPSLSQYVEADNESDRLLRETGLLDLMIEPPSRWQQFLQLASLPILRNLQPPAALAQRFPAQTLAWEQQRWQRAERFDGGLLDTPAALAWYGEILGQVADSSDFRSGFEHLARHSDATQLRDLVERHCVAQKRDLPWRVAERLDDSNDLARYVAAGNQDLAEKAASRLASLALDHESATPREPYWSALLQLGAAHADLLILHTVDADNAGIDSMARWHALWQACNSDPARRHLIVQCFKALIASATRERALTLAEQWHAQEPQYLRHFFLEDGFILEDQLGPRSFGAALRDTASPLRELVALVCATYLCRPRGFGSPPPRLNGHDLNAALAAYPHSFAALEDKHRQKLLPLLDARAVAACGATLAELMSSAGKAAREALQALIARTPVPVLRDAGLLDLRERKARLLLLTGMAQNADAPAVEWNLANIDDKAHDDYSRGLGLDVLAQHGHPVQALDAWAVDSLPALQALAQKQKISAAAGKAWNDETARLLQPLDEVLGRYLLQVLIEAGDVLPRRARQILALLPAARRADFAAYGIKTWIAGMGADKCNWLLLPLPLYGDERVANDLVRAAKAWMKTRKQKASVVMHLLCQVPGSYGIAQVRELWESRKFSESIQSNAEEALTAAAQREGLGLHEFLEQLVPDFGFGRTGLVLDVGPYAYTARLRGDFSVVVVDANGKPSKTLPRIKAGENAELRGVAENQLKMLAKNLKPLFKQQSQRLLRALQTGKIWAPQRWRSLFVEHPLLAAISQAVVWSALDAQGESLLRLRPSESGELVDAQDTPVSLPADARLRVAHPQEIPAAELAQWRSQFVDYELISPMGQFAVAVVEPQADELAHSEVRRADGSSMSRAKLGGLLEKWGYLKGSAEDGGMISQHSWYPGAEWRVKIHHTGISASFDADEEVTVGSIAPWRNVDEEWIAVKLGELPPAFLCTLLVQAEALKATAVT